MENAILTNMKKPLIAGIAALIVIAGLVAWGVYEGKKPGKYDALAQCISDSGAKFYGAFWCPHCANQKKEFGSSAKLLPYVECSTPDGQGVLPVCQENEVKGYPTWVFADASRINGEATLAELSAKTMCPLPLE